MPQHMSTKDAAILRYEVGQIFTPSTPVTMTDLFAGRVPQISKLIDAIAEPGRHAIIYGERGVGKTSLVQVIDRLIPSKNRVVQFFRKPCDPSDDFTSVWKKLFQDIRFTILDKEETKTYSVEDLYPNRITTNDVVRELKRSFGPNDIPIFVIDEFNELRDSDAAMLMANTIKALSDEGVNATIIIVGVADSIGNLFREHASIDRCCEEVPMPRMSHDELGEIIDTRIKQLGMTIEPDARWKIIGLSKGLPMYVHTLGKQACFKAVSENRRDVRELDVDTAINVMLESSQLSLRDKYERAVFSNQPGNQFKEVLLACALARADDNGYFPAAALLEPMSKILGRAVVISTFQNHLNGFIGESRGEILQRVGEERAFRFRFRQPEIQPYVLMRGIKDGRVENDLGSILAFPQQPRLFPNEP